MSGLVAVIFIGLVVASAIIFAQHFYRSDSEIRKNKKRIYTWWIIFIICLPVCIFGGWLTYLFVCGLFSLALFELIKLSSLGINYFFASLLIFILVSFYEFSESYLYLSAFLLFSSAWLAKFRSGFSFFLVILYIGACLQSLLQIVEFSQLNSMNTGMILLSLLFISAINDIAQYIAGRKFGRRPLASKISPNKTIEGAAGGLFVTGLVSVILLPDTLNVRWPTALAIGLVLSLLGILGDLYFSKVKRSLGIKDTGNLLPGHGGVLDRMDSMLLVAPGFGLVLIYLIG
jgi:phosphatidate cytidylyltransferase